MTIDASVIIPSLGRLDQLRNCIGGVLSQDSDYVIEIVVVVDGLDSESLAKTIESEFRGRAELLFDSSLERRGSAAAKNIGAHKAQGDLLVFIDDDTVPARSWLRSIIESYSDDVVGVGGSERKRGRQPFLRRLLFFIQGNRTGRVTKSGMVISNFTPEKKSNVYVDCLPGCNMSFRREVFLQSGGFDENYVGTAYREETDFCMRIRPHGKLLFVPIAVVDHAEHEYGGNSPSSYRDWNYWYHRNNTYFFLKNFRPVSKPLWVRHCLVELTIAVSRMFLSLDPSPIGTMRSGIADGKKMSAGLRG
ncbi:MAG: glycosyltransferase family 2 protein [Methanobacteriota archaeon]|nr:MAG: glycosyltransferase family 2 protein [Euryarchaeota archaeon]